MKRMLCVMLAVLMLLPVFASTAFAHGGHGHAAQQRCVSNQVCKNNDNCVTNGNCTNNCQFADENNDGICDNCKNQCVNCGEAKDENADGICDDCGKCNHYADENNDGVCDHQANCENRKNAACKSTYRKSGHRGGRHGHHR